MGLPVSATSLRNRLLGRARLRHLHVFVKVAELQTVKKAADAVGITQPSATQCLADLEKLLECNLFLRHSQGMALTRAGELLLPLARRMLGLVDDTATRAAEIAQGAVGVIRIAAISAAIGSHLGEALPAFARQQSQTVIELIEADAQRHASLLANREVDCTICRRPSVMPAGWSFIPLWADQFGIVAGASHPLSRKRRVNMSDLLSNTWLVPPSSIAAREVLDRFFSTATPSVRHYNIVCASPTMLWTLLSKEPLLSLVPLSVMQRFLQTGLLTQIRWTQEMPFDDIGVLVAEADRGQALDALLSFLQTYATQNLRNA
ncbi:LysR family transcriptional regulator [Hydrogenophaga palleronii]|uniref:LysR family transcriptional regulator n=1 Tax=Hydrogenophaga palleronii TaxID=65655 RepID=UPI0008266617|nr:LysR family transcriptional regulator [Hydrogenophaga palleronii]